MEEDDPPPVVHAVPVAPATPVATVAPADAAPSAPTPVSMSTEPRSSERGAKRGKPPFRLCFTVPGVGGRSALPPACLNAAPVGAVTGKFYSREEEKVRVELQRMLDEQQAAGGEPAGQRRGVGVLESCRYGEYPRPLVTPRIGDRRLHFAYRTSEMVKVQCAIARAAALAPGAGGGGHGPHRRATAPAPAAPAPS
ncbi:uncharacterized protein LOC127750025 [Frankliniella occidentalis]|uniref:Uncharacterized protein LOC127750025 n=1 Tax=Frankliniella occidentalis TaxID=133901 RepID=A0A9C6U6T9_FRAOC|nr:uncharacterized protein LOC127750025 [Frankliniella occidentalis]XP_052126396.1 uncharacterized protein LOC127750025 [Frankliniella occidentalis]XP_052126397.1 uncharacterized protein LOC127750025 [Frankliniella occidentalis]